MDDDIIVVGGRCAGAPSAMLLARAGFRVRVLERSTKLGDTLSGHMVKPAGTTRLQAWGLLDAVMRTGAPPIGNSRVWLAGQLIGELDSMASEDGAEDGPDGQRAAKVAPAVAPRRGALDPVLLEGARQAGAAVDMGNSVNGLLTEGSRVTGVITDSGEYRARLVIGADGRNSRVARLVGAAKYIDNSPATYAYYTYWKGAAVSEFCAFLDKGHFIGMFPTNDDLTMVFFQAPHAGFGAAIRGPLDHYLAVLKSQPAAMEFLSGAAPVESVYGTGDLPTFFRVSAGPGWALAGDAGHHKDPLIARGIPDAFRDAELITAAVISGWDGDLDQALTGYTRQRDACARPLSAANDSVASGFGAVPLGPLAEALGGLGKLDAALDPPSAIAARACAVTGTSRS
jgi:2-polyprenyl-6-methoxyphenol hydroxylase-like FAD-dependent oxidoreductase